MLKKEKSTEQVCRFLLRKKRISRFLGFAIMVILGCTLVHVSNIQTVKASPSIIAVKPQEGNGSADHPYQISTAEELYWFAELVNVKENKNVCAILTKDIEVNKGDVSGCGGNKEADWVEWTPIGDFTNGGFEGVFDGRGHTISGLYFNNNQERAGLFARVIGADQENPACVKNVGIINSFFNGQTVGGIAGQSEYAEINQCYNTATVMSDNKASCYVGGIVGDNYTSHIHNCYNIGETTGKKALFSHVAGICGYSMSSSGKISNCYYQAEKIDKAYNAGIKPTVKKTEGKSAAAFASGEVAYLLNANDETVPDIWVQNVDNGMTPYGKIPEFKQNSEASAVYQVPAYNCNKTALLKGVYAYSNSTTEHIPVHVYSSATGICTGCGKNHKEIAGAHSYDIYHQCTVCGYSCPHIYNKDAQDGVCVECNYKHEHDKTNFDENHICAVCGYYCKDHNYLKGTCTICGYEHTEHTYEKGACSVCGYEHQEHQFENGVCTICGYQCTHKYSDGTCTICGMECSDHHYVNGFCDVCKGCESAKDENSDGVYEVDNSGKLYWFAEQVNSGKTDMKAELTDNITVNSRVLTEDGSLVDNTESLRKWTPIGTKNQIYTGEFNGNGHTISGLYCYYRTDFAGLFGYASNAVIKNVGVKNSYFFGEFYVGGICAYDKSRSVILNCFNEKSMVTGTNAYIGGISGLSSQTNLQNCYNTAAISGKESIDCKIGGICGGFSHYDSGSVENCFSSGKVSFDKITGVPKYFIGGICGFSRDQNFKNCFYIDEEETDEFDGTVFKTREQFTSGEVTWLLDTVNGTEDHTKGWKQDLVTNEPSFDEDGLTISRFSHQKEDSPKRIRKYFHGSYDMKPLNLSGDWVYEGDSLDQIHKDGDSYSELAATIHSDLTIKQLVPINIKAEMSTDITGTYPREFSTVYICDYIENLENVGGIKTCKVTEGVLPAGLELSESGDDVGKIMGFCDEAGTYPVTLTLTGKYNQERELKLVFKIEKAEGEIKFKNYPESYTYKGVPINEPTNDNAETYTNKEGEFSRRWFYGYDKGKIDGLKEIDHAPKDVGVYTLEITKGETKNRKAASVTAKIEIRQTSIYDFLKEIEIIPYENIYDGKTHDAVKVSGVAEDMKIQYSMDESEFSEEIPQITDKGSYKIVIQISGSNYYNKYTCTDQDKNPWVTATITQKELTDGMIQEIPQKTYTGSPVTFSDKEVSIIDGEKTLVLGEDYEIIGYSQNIFAGDEAQIEIQGKNNYTGSILKLFTIAKAEKAPNMPEEELTVDYENEEVSDVGLPEDWEWVEKDFNKELIAGETVEAEAEYVGEDQGNYNLESVTIQITRLECTHGQKELVHKSDPTYTKEGYTGDIQCRICGEILQSGEVIPKLDPTDISGAYVYGIRPVVYTGKTQTLYLEVVVNGKTLSEDKDYIVDYENNIGVGEATVTITGTNGYTGTIVKYFRIKEAENAPNMPGSSINVNYSNETVSDIPLPENWEWKDTDEKKELIVGKAVVAEAEYTGVDKNCYKTVSVIMRITRLDCVHKKTRIVGSMEASYVSEGYTGDVYCKACGRIIEKGRPIEKLKPRSIYGAEVYGVKNLNYTGKAQTLSLKVIVRGKTLVYGTDYTVTYKNNVNIGTAEVCIKAKNTYSGSLSKKFKIAAPKGRIYSIGNMKYQIINSDGTVKLIGSTKAKATLKNYTINNSVKIGGKNFRIVAVGDKAFKGCKKLKKVTIGSNIVSLGKECFSGCKNLKTISLKSSKLKSIGKNAIKGIHKKAVIKVPSKQLKKYKKLLKSNTGYKKSMKVKK